MTIRTLAISDIHGCLTEFNLILEKVQYTPAEDRLVLVGDYVDRGADSKKVLEQVIAMKEAGDVIALRGNHDQMMYDAIMGDTDAVNARWIRNGARQTLESYCGEDFFDEEMDIGRYKEAKAFIKSNYMDHLEFLSTLEWYYESDSHIFVHAGVDPEAEDWRKQDPDNFIWIREPFYLKPTGLNKKVIFGHTPVMYLHESGDIWFSPLNDKIGIDGGCVFGKQLNCLEIKKHYDYVTHVIYKGEPPISDVI